MTVKINLIQKSFYISFLFILVIAASIFIDFPFGNVIILSLSAIILILSIVQMLEIIRVKKLLLKTSDILSQGNERDFSVLKEDEKEKNIIDYKITNLIEQLEDSVRQSNMILKDKDKLTTEVKEKNVLLQNIQKALNQDIVEIKKGIVSTVSLIDRIMAEMIQLQKSCDTENSMLNNLLDVYSTYENSYGDLNTSIDKSRIISEREITRSDLLIESISDLYNRSESSESQMQTIFKGIENIRDVTDIINEFAEKASILSLNAAIESAHAGEAGKGFAVVAEEVGVLATSTAEHAENINTALYTVTDLIQETTYSEESGIDSYPELIDEVKAINRSLMEIRDMLNVLSTLKKPEPIEIKDAMVKDRDTLAMCIRSLKSMKLEMDRSVEEIGKLTLIPSSPELARDNKIKMKLTIHETTLKPVKDESSIEL